jgi:putative AdoMet-dependent methyltransferase
VLPIFQVNSVAPYCLNNHTHLNGTRISIIVNKTNLNIVCEVKILDNKLVWQYNEMLQKGATFSDIKRAETYDKQMQKFRNYECETEYLVEKLSINRHSAVIDIGCGTGALTIGIAKHAKCVFAVDTSLVMLEILKRKSNANDLKNIEFINAGFLSYNHTKPSVDIVVTKGAFHHLADFWKVIALQNMNNMLKDNGLLFLSDVVFSFECDDYVNQINLFLNNMRQLTDEDMLKDAIIHIKDECSTFDWLLDQMILKTNFEIIEKNIKSNTNVDYICKKLK